MTHSHLFQDITLVKSEGVSGQDSVLAKISDAVHVMTSHNLGGINHIMCFIDHVLHYICICLT